MEIKVAEENPTEKIAKLLNWPEGRKVQIDNEKAMQVIQEMSPAMISTLLILEKKPLAIIYNIDHPCSDLEWQGYQELRDSGLLLGREIEGKTPDVRCDFEWFPSVPGEKICELLHSMNPLENGKLAELLRKQ